MAAAIIPKRSGTLEKTVKTAAKKRAAKRPATIKCIHYPNRDEKRTWSARAVARCYCTAVSEGVPAPEIEEEITQRCRARVKDKKPVPGNDQDAALAFAEKEIGNNVSLLRTASDDYGVMKEVISALIALGILIVVGRFARPALLALRAVIAARELQIAAQQRANAAAIAVIQRARAAARAAETVQ